MKRIFTLALAALWVFAALGAKAEKNNHIQARLELMTIEEKVAQMFLARCPSSGALETIERYQPGGYILFAGDFEGETSESISETIALYQAASKVPMLIGVDEEGGTVTRVSRYKAFRDSKFKSPRALYEDGGMHAIIEDAQEKSRLLKSLGVNFNLAPVCDLANSGAFMGSRSISDDPEVASLFAASVVRVMNQEGILSALKHFPGYGANADTHVGLVVDKRDYAAFVKRDFLPFEAAIRAGAGCVLVSHNIVNAMDKNSPASLSPEVHRVLREELGFTGVVMTDDLAMGAITEQYGAGESAVMAVEAGGDLLCSTQFVTQYKAVLEAVKDGRISEARIDQSVERILTWKQSANIL